MPSEVKYASFGVLQTHLWVSCLGWVIVGAAADIRQGQGCGKLNVVSPVWGPATQEKEAAAVVESLLLQFRWRPGFIIQKEFYIDTNQTFFCVHNRAIWNKTKESRQVREMILGKLPKYIFLNKDEIFLNKDQIFLNRDKIFLVPSDGGTLWLRHPLKMTKIKTLQATGDGRTGSL